MQEDIDKKVEKLKNIIKNNTLKSVKLENSSNTYQQVLEHKNKKERNRKKNKLQKNSRKKNR